MASSLPDPRSAILPLCAWLDDDSVPPPSRQMLATAVRASLYELARIAPGNSVEVRVPPFAAIQCVTGITHRRGTPPNVVEMDPRTWLRIAAGRELLGDNPQISISGTRASEIARWLPIVRIPAQ